MYNLVNLQTFVRVAEVGSFNKVAEQDFLSPNTVMRQITALEEEFGNVKLFERNNKGSKLTEAGELLYEDAKAILLACEESKKRIIKALGVEEKGVRFAVTYESEFEDYSNLWKRIHELDPELKLEIVPVIYDFKLNKSLWSDFAEHTDVLITYLSGHDFSEYKGLNYAGISLGKAKLKCAMSSNHRLAAKKTIVFEDLKGEEVSILKSTWSNVHGAVADHIREKYPDIKLSILPYFGAEGYNNCANGENIILTFTDLTKAHPFITTVPMDEAFETSLGLTYLNPPSPAVERLVNLIREELYG